MLQEATRVAGLASVLDDTIETSADLIRMRDQPI